jgi:hypothetical protein
MALLEDVFDLPDKILVGVAVNATRVGLQGLIVGHMREHVKLGNKFPQALPEQKCLSGEYIVAKQSALNVGGDSFLLLRTHESRRRPTREVHYDKAKKHHLQQFPMCVRCVS